MAPAIVPEPINNLSNKSIKVHAAFIFLTDGSVNPIKPFVSGTISHAPKQSVNILFVHSLFLVEKQMLDKKPYSMLAPHFGTI